MGICTLGLRAKPAPGLCAFVVYLDEIIGLVIMILVLHHGAIGDFVLTLSVVQAVRSLLDERHRSHADNEPWTSARAASSLQNQCPPAHGHSKPYPVGVIASSALARLAAGRSAIDVCTSPEQVGLHTLFSDEGPLDERLAAMLHRARWVVNFLGGTAE